MNELHLPSTLENSRRMLVSGAGGGFDPVRFEPCAEIETRHDRLNPHRGLHQLPLTAIYEVA